jgi:hypothetical protein
MISTGFVSMANGLHELRPLVQDTTLKKLLLLACLSFVLAPLGVQANTQKPKPKPKGAPEMPAVGFGAAAAIGIAGYLLLRRRHASQN